MADQPLPGWASVTSAAYTLRLGGWVEPCEINGQRFLRLRTEEDGTELTCIAMSKVHSITPITETIGRLQVRNQWPAAFARERAPFTGGDAA